MVYDVSSQKRTDVFFGRCDPIVADSVFCQKHVVSRSVQIPGKAGRAEIYCEGTLDAAVPFSSNGPRETIFARDRMHLRPARSGFLCGSDFPQSRDNLLSIAPGFSTKRTLDGGVVRGVLEHARDVAELSARFRAERDNADSDKVEADWAEFVVVVVDAANRNEAFFSSFFSRFVSHLSFLDSSISEVEHTLQLCVDQRRLPDERMIFRNLKDFDHDKENVNADAIPASAAALRGTD